MMLQTMLGVNTNTLPACENMREGMRIAPDLILSIHVACDTATAMNEIP